MADQQDWSKLKGLTPFYSADRQRVEALERELEARKREDWTPDLSELTDAEYARRFPSEVPSMTEYTPSLRERAAAGLQRGFEKVPTVGREQARRYAQSIVGGESSSMPFKLGAVDILGGTRAFGAPRAVEALAAPFWGEEGLNLMRESGKQMSEGNVGTAYLDAALGALGLLPGAELGMAVAKPAAKALAPTAAEMASNLYSNAVEHGLAVPHRLDVVRPKGGQWVDYAQHGTELAGRSNRTQKFFDNRVEMYQNDVNNAKRVLEQGELPRDEAQRVLTEAEGHLERALNMQALTKWNRGPLLNYVKKQMGTPEDPIRLLAEEGIHHRPLQNRSLLEQDTGRRERRGFPAEGMGTSGLAKTWEIDADRALQGMPARFFTEEGLYPNITERYNQERSSAYTGEPSPAVPLTPEEREYARDWTWLGSDEAQKGFLKEHPWLKTVPGETNIWSMVDYGDNLGFNHIMDVLSEDLMAGRLRPDSLSRMSVAQAVRRTSEYDAERAAAMEKAQAEDAANQNVFFNHDNGYKWVTLDKPGQFSKESDNMGHSVRGYEPPTGHPEWISTSGSRGNLAYGHGGWEGIKSGRAQVISLRDEKNLPHTTIEMKASDYVPHKDVEEMLIRSGIDRERARDYMRNQGIIDEQGNLTPDNEDDLRPLITQVKGKVNDKPVAKYIPMIQQLIRKNDYEVARDLEHTDLIDARIGDTGPQWFYDKKWYHPDLPKYMTKSEIENWRRTGEFTPDPHLDFSAPKEEGHATGGAVHMADGGIAPYGLRHGSPDPKGKGYFGPMRTPPGDVMTELSAENNAGEFPLIVPTLTREELEYLIAGGKPTDAIYNKASQWAETRRARGRTPFATPQDLRIPKPMAGGGIASTIAQGVGKLMKTVLPATERQANLAKFLEPSKVPMRLYHGTTATEGGKGAEAIRSFKPSKEGALGYGVYLTPNAAKASTYSGIPNEEALAQLKETVGFSDQVMKDLKAGSFREDVFGKQQGGNMLPVYAQIKNPLVIEGKGDPMVEALTKLGMDPSKAERVVERAYDTKGYIGKEVESRARAAGYDGLMQYRNGNLEEVVSYNPRAIKSAIGNQGTYDTSNIELSKAGGGRVGAVKSVVDAVRKMAEDLPPPEAAQKTQIRGTLGTYKKAGPLLESLRPGGNTLDYGSGLGHGAQHLGADSFEPFPKEGVEPTYKHPTDIPDSSYDRVTNFSVLNVLPKAARDEAVKHIGRVLKPEGVALITARGPSDVMAASGDLGPEAASLVTSIGTYQKGFTTSELHDYVKKVLGNGYEVRPMSTLSGSGVMIKKVK
jgi:SAM-dependent methyltransferase